MILIRNLCTNKKKCIFLIRLTSGVSLRLLFCSQKSQNRRIMNSIIGLLIGLLEAGLALWFRIELISSTCF